MNVIFIDWLNQLTLAFLKVSTNLIPCPMCNVNTIDKNRNKRKKCKKCADKIPSNKKHKQASRLSFEDGCKVALHNNNTRVVFA